MNNQKPPSQLPKILSSVYLCIVVYLIYTRVLSDVLPGVRPMERSLTLIGFFTIVVAACRYIHGFVHELGHLVFGGLCRYHFLSFRLFRIVLIREKGQLKLRRFRSPGSFVYCQMAPPETVGDEYPIVLPLLGGALMSLLCAILLGLLGMMSSHFPFLQASLFILAAIGLQFAALDAIPYHSGSLRSDADLAMFIRSSAENRRVYRILGLIEKRIQDGIRLRDMPDEWFTLSSDQQMHNSLYATLSLHMCSQLMDQHKFREAHDLIGHLLSIESALTPIQRGLMNCNLMFTELIGENRPQFLQELLTPDLLRFMNSVPDFVTVLRTRYAYILLHGHNPQAAQQYKARLTEIIKTYPCPWDAAVELELIAIADAAAARQPSNV